MKNIKRNLLLLACFALLLFLAGCSQLKPLSVDTKLTVDKNFRGQREMTAVMTGKEFDVLFDKDLDGLNKLLKDNSPVDMDSLATLEENGSVKITLSIPFASYTEYYEKIMKIFSGSNSYDENRMPSVYFEYSDSLLKKGFAVEENFTSTELFFWLTDVMLSEIPQLSGKTADEIFTAGTTTLVFDGEEIPAESMIKISRIDANALETITVETTLNSNGSFDAVIDYYAGADVVEKLGQKLTQIMSGLTPEGGTFSSKTTEDGTVFTIKVNAVSAEDYVKKLNKALHTDNTVFEVAEESDELDTLKARKKITQYLDGSYFLDFSDENTVMTYVLKASPEHSFENCESAYKYIKSCNFDNTDDYCSTYVTVAPSDKITLSLGYSVDIDKVEVETIMNNEKDFVRNLRFTLTPEQNSIIGGRFEERINERLGDNITYEKTKSGSNTVYTVTLRADSATLLSELTCAFLDGNSMTGNSSLEGGRSDEDRLNKVSYAYTDKMDLSIFLSGSQSTKGLYYRFQYPKNFTGHFVENNNYENVLEDYNVLTCVTHNKVIEVRSFAQKANIVGILQRVFLLLSLAGMLIVLLLNIGAILRCVKKRSFDAEEFGLFSSRGYIFVTIFSICAVVFVISAIRLLFGIY